MSTAHPNDSAQLPASIAGYQIESVLGAGGMGVVYLAQNPTLARQEALKVLSAEPAINPDLRARFLHEAITTSSLHHPNIISIFNRGEDDNNQLWIAMEYIAGTDAETALRNNTMTPSRALHITTEVARALDYAHDRGVVHQDIKPANFLLSNQPSQPERVVLSDFGAAVTPRSTNAADGQPMITSLAYTAPEVFMNRPLDGRTDVYSLGCALYRLLTASYPYPAHSSVADTLKARLELPPPRLSDTLPWATPELDDVIIKALAKHPDDRFATAGELATAATHAFSTSTTTTPPNSTTARPDSLQLQPAKPRLRADFTGSTRLLATASVAALVLTIATLIIWLPTPSPTPNPTTTPSPTTAPADLTARLTHLLPAGYPAGTCTPTPTSDSAIATTITCGPNRDPGGPTDAVYTLYHDATALHDAFQNVMATATTEVCPGRIQSPGPWRKVANPAITQGTVFCGTRDDRPTMAWTVDSQLLLANIQSHPPANPDLDQLYTWWSTHS